MKQKISISLSTKEVTRMKELILPIIESYKKGEINDNQLMSNIIARINIIYKLNVKYAKPKIIKNITSLPESDKTNSN